MTFKKIVKSLSSLKKLRFLDIILICILLSAIILLYIFFNPEKRWIRVLVLSQNIPIYQTNSLKVGNIEKDPLGETTAQLIKLEFFETPGNSVTNRDSFLNTALLVKINKKTGEYEYKNRVVKIGSSIELLFDTVIVNGKIIDVTEKKQDQEKMFAYKTLGLKIYSQWPWLADSIQIGQGEIGESGDKIIEVLQKETTPAEITVTTATGETFLQTDPRKVDIVLKVKAKVQRFGDTFVFRKDTRVIVGQQIDFNAGDTRVQDVYITQIYD